MLKNAAKRVFACKDRCRYSRKRPKFCQKIGNYPTRTSLNRRPLGAAEGRRAGPAVRPSKFRIAFSAARLISGVRMHIQRDCQVLFCKKKETAQKVKAASLRAIPSYPFSNYVHRDDLSSTEHHLKVHFRGFSSGCRVGSSGL